jgi:hypothetical protein
LSADGALQPNAVRQEHRDRDAVFPKVAQEYVLQALTTRFSHAP